VFPILSPFYRALWQAIPGASQLGLLISFVFLGGSGHFTALGFAFIGLLVWRVPLWFVGLFIWRVPVWPEQF